MDLEIKETDKILIIAPHPDDEAIACGGFILKYHKQIDVLCVNSSGVKYSQDTLSAEEIADNRCKEFVKVMEFAGINNYYIEKIWGVPPMINQIKKHFNDYLKNFDFKDYDYIFVPHSLDAHIEHRYVGNKLLKCFLFKTGYKRNLKIVRYELWSTIQKPNCYVDITDYVQQKEEMINAYVSKRAAGYAKRILGLNCYRALQIDVLNPEKYVEAYYIEDVIKYMYNFPIDKIFSIQTLAKNNHKQKVINLLGIKIKFRLA